MSKKIISLLKYNKENLLEKGKKAIYEDRIDEALEIFEKLYRIDSQDVSIIYNLAAIYIEKGDTNRSEELLLESHQKDENHLFTLIGLANLIFYKTENLKKAITYLDIALKEHDKSVDLYVSYANLYMIDGQYNSSLEFYKKAFDLEPKNETVKSGLSMVYNFIGKNHLKKHEFLNAMNRFKDSVKLNENWISPHLNIIRTLSYAGNMKRAFQIVQQLKDKVDNLSLDYVIVDKNLWQEEITHTLLMIKLEESKLFFRTGEKRKALNILKKIYRINSEFPSVGYLIALILLDFNELLDANKYIKAELNNYNSIKAKTLRYIINEKLNKASSWKGIHLNILKKETSDVYVLYDSAMLLKKYGYDIQSDDLLKYAKSLNPVKLNKLLNEIDVDLIDTMDLKDDLS